MSTLTISPASFGGFFTPETPAACLLKQIRGREIRAPDLRVFYAGVTSDVNKHYEEIIPYVNQLLERVVPDKRHLEAAKQCDIAYFAAWSVDLRTLRLE